MVRFKNRYILFDIQHPSPYLTDPSLSEKAVYFAIRNSIETHLGSYGAGVVLGSFTVKYFSPYTNIGIIRITRDFLTQIWACLSFITHISDSSKPCFIRVLHVGGTIKKCQWMAIQKDREAIRRIMVDLAKSKNVNVNNDDDDNVVVDEEAVKKLEKKSEEEIMSIQI